MVAAFFHDECFFRDASGTYYSTGAVPYAALARYLEHLDRIVVVGRVGTPRTPTRTVASGAGVEWACVEASSSIPRHLLAVTLRAREVLARVQCAIIRMPSIIGIVACREAVRRGVPYLVEVVGNGFEALWTHGSLQGKLSALPVHLLTRHYVGRAPFALYVTREALQRAYPPGGAWAAVSDVIVDGPREGTLTRRLDRIARRPDGAPAVLGLMGSYDVAYKGHETALRALSLLRAAGRSVTLRCVGVGDPARWRARAAALGLERHVELGGALPHGEPVVEWMDALDVLLVPSLTEGLPRALVEAMSRALPAVGSRRGGIPELLDAPWLHPPGDHRALARLVGALLDSREEMKAQARRNWRAAAEFATEILAARRDRLVREFKTSVLARGRVSPSRSHAPRPRAAGSDLET